LHPHAPMNRDSREQKQQKEMTDNPGRDDVHEQRHPAQPREGVVPNTPPGAPRPPTTTQGDQDRADWEGMGQPQGKPPTD